VYRLLNTIQPTISALLFELLRPLDELENMLLDEFAGQTLTMLEVYNQHHVGKRYIKKNYKQALLKLEAEGKIIVDPIHLTKKVGEHIRRAGRNHIFTKVVVAFFIEVRLIFKL
jgi:hypothetical protein